MFSLHNGNMPQGSESVMSNSCLGVVLLKINLMVWGPGFPSIYFKLFFLDGSSHRVDRVLGFLSSTPNWLPPPPPSVPPPHLRFQGGEHSLAGGGGPIRTKGQTLWYSRNSIIPLRVIPTWGSLAKHCPDSRQQSTVSPCQWQTPHPQYIHFKLCILWNVGYLLSRKKIVLCKLGIRKLLCNYLTKVT